MALWQCPAAECSRTRLVGDRTKDRERKLPDYRAIPSLQDRLVVSSTEPRIERFRRERDGWKIHDLRGQGTVRLEALDTALDVVELYAGVMTLRDTKAGDPPGP